MRNPDLPSCLLRDNQDQQKIAAAQIKYEQNQPPSGGMQNADSPLRSRFSYFASVFVLFGGIWLLFSLLRSRLQKKYLPKSARLAKVWNFALKPSFALSAFAFLFLTVVVGSVLTSPTTTSAQKRDQKDETNVANNAANLGLPTSQPVFKSAQQIGGDGVTQIGAPVFDTDGNRYVRGAFTGTLTIGETTLTSTYGLDMFIAKYDAELNPIWVRQGSGLTTAPSKYLATEGATAMSVYEEYKQDGALYVAGSFVKTLTLQGGDNPPITLTDNGGAGYNYETFLAKYDLNGNLIWARGGNSGSPQNSGDLETGQNAINKIVFDRYGDPYVAGLISGEYFLGLPISGFVCSGNQNCALHGKSDIIIAKLDKETGAPTRVHVLGGTDDDNALDLAIDNITNPSIPKLFLIGNFSSPQIVFPGSTGYETYDNTPNSINSFVIKFDADIIQRTTLDGTWAKVLNNDGIIGVNQITTDPVNGQAYITGYYTGSISGIPSPFGNSITNTRTGTGDAALAGYVASLDATNGNFVNIVNLGGAGNAIAARSDGTIFIVGTLWDSGQFGGGSSGDAITVDSLGRTDIFVASISSLRFSFNSVKTAPGSNYEGQIAVGNPSAADGTTINRYSPLGIAFNSNNRVFVSGDFQGTISLDCLTLTTPGVSRQSYIAEFYGYNEPKTCRIWANTDPNYRYWIEPSNWNDGIIPAAGDSVFVPYHLNPQYNPLYNPSFYNPNSNVPLGSVSITDNQAIDLAENMTINDRLDLLGGRINAGDNRVNLGAFAEAYSVSNGRVIGKVQKIFFGFGNSFTFPVGTENGYSPVTLSNINAGKGANFAVTANQGAYPNAAENLPVNRADRWWNLTNGGLLSADLTFQYLPGDITSGTESGYRAFRIPTGGGTATQVASTINTTDKTVFVPDVSQFSDWTLAQPFAPTAATVSLGGRVVSPNGYGIPNAQVTMTDTNGNVRTVLTNGFGYYNFERVMVSNLYVFTASHKRFTFSQPQVFSAREDRNDINFIGD